MDRNSRLFSHRLIDIMNAITDGIYVTDKHGNTVWLNDASEKNLRRPRSEFIGKNSLELEEAGIFTPSVVRMILETGRPVSTVQSVNSDCQYLVTGHLLRDEQGEIEYIVIHSRDITQAVQLTNQFEELESLLSLYSDEIRKIKLAQNTEGPGESFIGKSLSYRAITQLIEKISAVEATVLITGETGVGKNVVARRIHQVSRRSNEPFIEVNCGAIPESLIESELFGYKKGAFTGANVNGKIGLVQLAHRGTLYLDEIAELPLHLQSTLLQFLQSRTFRPVGDTEVKKADVRIIAATNSDLKELISQGKFRADLYYRLHVVPIHIPALRQRREDIPPLVSFFLKSCNEKYRKQRRISKEAMALLQAYDWPGNIRELENTIEFIVITAKTNPITHDDLPEPFHCQPADPHQPGIEKRDSLPEKLEQVERELIKDALRRHKTTRKTAAALGVSQSFLIRRLKKYCLYNSSPED
ncbi:sigma-54 interaction domain-containing protein [Brevibacillus massiliensis]|uniref:sigma-54 interaction domain-containing protein n=1 Tax=Brevibacillus massiliensis TaxID=1118054 RepID=UPI0002E40F75|nr:sigma 54-interacting transcriptional regulator [Brevibacillus massiliensis]